MDGSHGGFRPGPGAGTRGTGSRGRVYAVLGPTNTGKTYLAVERMLGHRTGMIGFPLRLLARENYDRIVAARGTGAVALVTGEEKIVPPRPSYWVCTVESMPLDRQVGFLAVDEIQMAADPERGHMFTERLLTARGLDETMFLGAETARDLIRRLVPGVELIQRPRFSSLTYAGHRKVTRLPPRSAVVAFSAAEVYRLAELVRRQRGGTAVVLGALSPRARNAQVGMYQAGEVDYLVATDAIGMGLNMDVRHVAFSGLAKYDGRQVRDLTAGEIGQIAGRAGRHMSDGTFGTTADQGPMDADLVLRVEDHSFEPLKRIFWRNFELDFRSVEALLRSLEAKPPYPFLVRAREGDDQRALAALAKDERVARRATSWDAVHLLWDVCQIPDFRKTMTDAHTQLLARVFGYLATPDGRLPKDWVARHVGGLDRTDGDIDALMARIAGIRVWTYIAHRTGWVDDPQHWQERSRAIEDRLSDALHERLTQRFVDRRTAVLMRRLRDGDELLGAVTRSGEVVVEGEYVGTMQGFRFQPDRVDRGEDSRPLLSAAQRVLRAEIGSRVERFEQAPDEALSLDGEARICWEGSAVAALMPGADVLQPRAEALGSDLLDGAHRAAIRRRAQAWIDGRIARLLRPLTALRDLRRSTAAARGIGWHLAEMLGVLPREAAGKLLGSLDREDRRALTALGVRFGRETLFVPRILSGPPHRLRLLLWRLAEGLAELPPAPGRRTLSYRVDPEMPADWHRACGFRVIGPMAVRVDALERLAARAHDLGRQGELAATPELAALARLGTDDLAAVLRGLGFRRIADSEGVAVARFAPRGNGARRGRRPAPAADASSPFAALGALRQRA